MSAIVVKNLVKGYRDWLGRPGSPVLRDVSLEVSEGTVFGLMGPNGAGKTTFIKSLLGIIEPDGGDIQIFGTSPFDPKSRERIGYLPEKIHFVPGTTARSFLQVTARLRGVTITPGLIESELSRVGLDHVIDDRVTSFSKGMKQRVGVAAALLGKPDLLILDEPTDGIDPIGRSAIRTLIREESERGATIFLNSHLLSETERICQRVGVLVNGRVVREGPIDELRRVQHAWIIDLEGEVPDSDLQSLGLEPGAEAKSWIYRGPDVGHLNDVLDRVRQLGGYLVALRPEERDLESVLVDAVEQEEP